MKRNNDKKSLGDTGGSLRCYGKQHLHHIGASSGNLNTSPSRFGYNNESWCSPFFEGEDDDLKNLFKGLVKKDSLTKVNTWILRLISISY